MAVSSDNAEMAAGWATFDPAWYYARHAAMLDLMDIPPEQAQAFYEAHGAALGHSPNPFFDEDWYRATYPDVAQQVLAGTWRSGFDHYLNAGLDTHDPHWLFDTRTYLAAYPDITPATLAAGGYRNAYDHYLRTGDGEMRSGSCFFDPETYLALLAECQHDTTTHPFADYLRRGMAALPCRSVSLYFDAEWYAQTYPDAHADITQGMWRGALHHYLCNTTPQAFDPGPFFSESFYAMVNPDVLGAIEAGNLRNGYAHFLSDGVHEQRKPCSTLDLAQYMRDPGVQADIAARRARDGLGHYLAARPDLKPSPPPMITEEQARTLFRHMCNARLPLLLNGGIDFTSDAPPALSVIIVAHDQFALTMSTLASLRANYHGSMQVLLVDSGSRDGVAGIEDHVRGIEVLRFAGNIGFVRGCNAALARVRAPATLYLNNDVDLQYGAVARALSRLMADEATGAVGARVIRTHGLLQEAGSLIWRDGSVQGYMRDAHPCVPEAGFVRAVDFCSGVFLMVRTDVLQVLDGFDESFAPAYFEETDLCMRIRTLGYRIMYDPGVCLVHYECGTSDGTSASRLIARNNDLFTRRHGPALRRRLLRHDPLQARARHADDGRHILFIEDRLPLRHLGSGFTRSNDIVTTLAGLGYHVTVFPIFRPIESAATLAAAFPETVEVIHDRELPDLPDFLRARSGCFDAIWIARTQNAARVASILNDAASCIPADHIVVDTEALVACRDMEYDRLHDITPSPPLSERLERELRPLFLAQRVVAVNAAESDLLRAAGFDNVSVLGHVQVPRPTGPGWAARRDILFLGAVHEMRSPNLDSLAWFSSEVLPLLVAQLGADIRFTVCGHTGPRVDLGPLRHNPNVRMLGRVADTAPVYDQHRVFVAPTRYAAGIAYKLHEAAANGLPVVGSPLLCQQAGWRDGQDMLCASVTDPADFARQVVRLYHDQTLWDTVRDNALTRIATEHAPQDYASRVADIMNAVFTPG
ncbi:glycosyltransferase [Komagataeibacter oboediens DSM 11826]|uniref:Glycosyl transferase n=1 Tax=Komagataeibacter oboediens TaxID=65958 RepID=A0A318QVR3_9PROT|nr:glycosyltransferase [Komagataeibacter oboediens]PYD81442.1 glycosyl transferase [Komagataeibacter oboediens]GBR32339.1 glycosyltransferase [Komagataeibacter oboediens DSM 11826]